MIRKNQVKNGKRVVVNNPNAARRSDPLNGHSGTIRHTPDKQLYDPSTDSAWVQFDVTIHYSHGQDKLEAAWVPLEELDAI